MSRPTSQIRAQLAQQNQATRNILSSYYAYSVIIPTIASTAPSSGTTQIQADADFMVQAMSAWVWDLTTNAVVAAPYATVQVSESGSGTTLFDQAVPINNAFGTAQLPFILPVPRLFVANSVISVAVTNVFSANADYFAFTFHGKKLYDIGNG